MRGQRKKNVIDKPQLEAVFIKFRVKDVLFKKAHEQVSREWGYSGAHGSYLEVMLGVER